MLNRPAFFVLLGAAGIAAVSYGCQLEDREAPAPNPKPGGGTPVVVGVGPGGTGANGGGGNGGEGAGTATGGGSGGEAGGGGSSLAEQLFPFCGCLEAGAISGACFDCLWSEGINGCTQEALNCNQSANCVEIKQFFMDGLCAQNVDPMCLETAIQGLEPGLGDFTVYVECACAVCVADCAPSACQ